MFEFLKSKKYKHDIFVHNTNAAKKLIPFLIELFKPNSVVDVGCGTGTWLKVCLENGITDLMGIEGQHLNMNELVVPKELIVLEDLEKPFAAGRKFDLALSLEVGEHLNSDTAHQYIKHLAAISDVVVFSSAIPYQGGQNHINEQWLSYWISRFQSFGFKPFDVIRPRYWDTPDVEFWYAQNCCIFINEKTEYEGLDKLPTFYNKNIAHPTLYTQLGEYRERIWNGEIPFSFITKLIAKKILRSFKK